MQFKNNLKIEIRLSLCSFDICSFVRNSYLSDVCRYSRHMTSNEDSVLNGVMRTVSVAVLIYLTALVMGASFGAFGLNFSINPLFGIFIPMGIVFVAFTLYYYREYE